MTQQELKFLLKCQKQLESAGLPRKTYDLYQSKILRHAKLLLELACNGGAGLFEEKEDE